MKSLNLNMADAEWMRGPLVPVTFRMYVPAVGELHDTVTVPEPARSVAVSAPQSSPAGTVSARPTVPLNPFALDTEMVAVAGPAFATPLAGGAPNPHACWFKVN